MNTELSSPRDLRKINLLERSKRDATDAGAYVNRRQRRVARLSKKLDLLVFTVINNKEAGEDRTDEVTSRESE